MERTELVGWLRWHAEEHTGYVVGTETADAYRAAADMLEVDKHIDALRTAAAKRIKDLEARLLELEQAFAEESATAASALAQATELRALLHFEVERFQQLYMEAIDREKSTSDRLGESAGRRIKAEARVRELEARLDRMAQDQRAVRVTREPGRVRVAVALGPVEVTIERKSR
ncbi:MAG: hypothetical protein M0R22_00365 [Dehalococcoidia bacterium]|jgi:chromosome segregation ATPase|nr:hypothetical protein [Dehalococcoidia bacterium]